jgi:hypothetical protein
MLEPIYSEPTQDEIIKKLEKASRSYFKCGLGEFVQKLDANQLPEEKLYIADIMESWLRGVSPDNVIFQSRRHKFS